MKRCAALIVFAMLGAPLAAAPPITAIAVAPDGKAIVIGSQAGIEVRTLPTLQTTRVLKTEMPNIHDLAFSPDGKSLAVAGGIPAKRGIVEMYSWPGGQLLRSVAPHRDSIYRVAWSSDSATLLTASGDKTITALQADSLKTQQTLEGHSRAVLAVAFLPGEAEVISAGVDGSVRVWNIKSGELIRSLSNHMGAVSDVTIRPTSNGHVPIAVSVGGDRTVRLWQPTIGRLIRFARLDSVPQAVEWTHDGKQICVTGADGRVRTLDPDTMDVLANLPGIWGVAYCIAIAPDGSILVGGQDGQIERVVLK